VAELLVQIGPQPRQLVGVAQILGVDDLVVLLREGLVVGPARLAGARHRRAHGFGRILAVGFIGIVRHFTGRPIGRFGHAVVHLLLGVLGALRLGGFGSRLVLRLAFLLRLLVAGGLVVRAVLVLVGVERRVLGHVEAGQHLPHRPAEPALVLQGVAEPVEILAGLLLNPRAPQIDDLLGRRRRLEAGHAFARDHRDRILQRRVRPVGDLVVVAAVIAVLQHRRQVRRHARHAPRADGLAPRLLDRIEHRPGGLGLRRQPAMHRAVVAGEPQRHRVGMPAHDRHVGGGHLARRLGQTRLVAGQRRAVGCERHLELGQPRDRPQRASHRPLERFGRRFLGLGRLAVGGHRAFVIQ